VVTDIVNAKDKCQEALLGGLPDVSEAITGFFYPLVFQHMQKQLIDGFVQEIPIEIRTLGVRQPFKAQQLQMLEAGQRAWKWETIHCQPDVLLKPDDIILIGKTRYRVMERFDYSPYGYMQYNVIEDYKGS
jgi:hypothetical protein